jgi:hypothetical protein
MSIERFAQFILAVFGAGVIAMGLAFLFQTPPSFATMPLGFRILLGTLWFTLVMSIIFGILFLNEGA